MTREKSHNWFLSLSISLAIGMSGNLMLAPQIAAANEPNAEPEIELTDGWQLRRSSLQEEADTNFPVLGFRPTIVGQTETFPELAEDVLTESFALRAAKYDLDASKSEVWQAVGNFLPKLSTTISHNWIENRNTISASNMIGKYEENTVRLDLSMTLLDAGTNYFGLLSAKATRRASEANYLAAGRQVELDAIEAYLTVYRNQKVERTILNSVKSLRKIRRITKALHRAGEVSRSDVALAQSELSSNEAEYNNAVARRKDSEAYLARLVRRPVGKRLKLPKLPRPLPASLEQARHLVKSNNATVNSAFHQADASENNAKRARGAYMPKLDLIGSYSNENIYRDPLQTEDDWRIGLQLTVPLTDFSGYSRARAQRARAQGDYYRALDTQRGILRQLDTDWANYHASKARMDALRRQVKALNTVLIGTRKEYKAGLRSLTDVLNARVNKTRAEVTMAQIEFERQTGGYRILLATGHDGLVKLAMAQ